MDLGFLLSSTVYLSQDVLLAFFTSVAQGILALAALLVTIAMFRLERTDKELSSASDSLKQLLEATSGEHTDQQALSLLVSMGYSKLVIEDSLLPNKKVPANIKDQVLGIYDLIRAAEGKAEDIRNVVMLFTGMAISSVGASLCAILLTEVLSEHRYIALAVVAVIFGLTAFTLSSARRLVKELLALGRWRYS